MTRLPGSSLPLPVSAPFASAFMAVELALPCHPGVSSISLPCDSAAGPVILLPSLWFCFCSSASSTLSHAVCPHVLSHSEECVFGR